MISINEGFCIIYDFLNEYWKQVDRNVDYSPNSFVLVDIISTMEPGKRKSPMPIDPAKYTDWLYVLKNKYGEKKEFNSTDIYNAMINYLEFYGDNFGFNVDGVIKDLNHNISGKYNKMWVEAIKKNMEYME